MNTNHSETENAEKHFEIYAILSHLIACLYMPFSKFKKTKGYKCIR